LAVHTLCWLELLRRRGMTPASSVVLARSSQTHPVRVRQVLTELRGAGLVTATRGRGAGWDLTQPGSEISLADVHIALREQRSSRGWPFSFYAHEPNPECVVGRGIRPALSEVNRELDDVISTTLDDVSIGAVLERCLHV